MPTPKSKDEEIAGYYKILERIKTMIDELNTLHSRVLVHISDLSFEKKAPKTK